MKEFNLSDKEFHFLDDAVFHKEDVKEFIKIVIEDIAKNVSEKKNIIELGKIISIINKRSGDKLR